MARFYGWCADDIEKMEMDDFQKYYQAIDIVEAREMILSFDSSTFPHLKKAARQKLFAKYLKRAKFVQSKNSGNIIDQIEKTLRIGNV